MSTKTLRKRIALSTVVALGAGVLSLGTVTSANATGYGDAVTGAVGGYVNTIVTGSTGLVSPAIATGNTVTGTATLLSAGTLVVTPSWGSGHNGYYVVSAGGSITTATSGNTTVSADQSTVLETATALTFSVKPTGAVGSTFTITGYDAGSSGTLAAAAAAVTTALEVITVTIAGTSVAGVPSVANSYVNWVNSATNTNTTADVSGANSTTTGNILQLEVHLRDAYKNDVTSTSGALVVTASTGATAGIASSYSSSQSAGTYTTAVSAASPADLWVAIGEATAGAGWAGTVTVSYNGVTIATKSGTITGVVSKIVVTPLTTVLTNTATDDAFSYQAYDSVGNTVAISSATGLAFNTSSNTAVVTTAASDVINTTSVAGTGTITGGVSAGTSNVSLKYVLANGSTVVTNSFPVTVGGAAASYKAAWDKSSYNQGDIAKLKITFLDSKGNIAGQGLTAGGNVYTVTSLVNNATVAQSMVTVVSGLPTVEYAITSHAAAAGSAMLDTTGSLVLTYTIGSNSVTYAAGTYATSVDFPTVDTRGAALGTGPAITSLVLNSTGGTSLNDVLKGIVALIASINKQIAALAKLVTKK